MPFITLWRRATKWLCVNFSVRSRQRVKEDSSKETEMEPRLFILHHPRDSYQWPRSYLKPVLTKTRKTTTIVRHSSLQSRDLNPKFSTCYWVRERNVRLPNLRLPIWTGSRGCATTFLTARVSVPRKRKDEYFQATRASTPNYEPPQVIPLYSIKPCILLFLVGNRLIFHDHDLKYKLVD